METSGITRRRVGYTRGKGDAPSPRAAPPSAGLPKDDAGSAAPAPSPSPQGDATTNTTSPAVTASWSHDPRAALGGVFEKHGRKLFWLAVLGYIVFFTNVPITKLLAWGVFGMLGLFLLMLYRQDSMLYHPVVDPRIPRRPPPTTNPKKVFKIDYEEVLIPITAGPTIHAWLMFAHGESRRSCHTMVFLHGNAGNIAHRLPNYAKLIEDVKCNILAVEYRGFGNSTGVPSEAGLKQDVDAALQYLHARQDIDRKKIVLFGRSLGGAVAIAAAAKAEEADRRVSGVIVENSFTSVADMARAVLPFVRVLGGWLPYFVRNKFESEEAIKSVTSPILFLSGKRDQLVPPAQMKRLKDAAAKARHREFREFPLGGHNDTFMKGGDSYYRAIRVFLDRHCADVPAPVSLADAATDDDSDSPPAEEDECKIVPSSDDEDTCGDLAGLVDDD